MRRLGALAGVSVPGLVPDLCPLWESTSVLLAPLRFSTGIQNKVLEAMAAGVPVVTTPPVAEALGARHGEHLRVADSTAGLAGAVVGLLRDRAASAPMTVRARELGAARLLLGQRGAPAGAAGRCRDRTLRPSG